MRVKIDAGMFDGMDFGLMMIVEMMVLDVGVIDAWMNEIPVSEIELAVQGVVFDWAFELVHIVILTFDSDPDDHQSAPGTSSSYFVVDYRTHWTDWHHDGMDNREMNYFDRQKRRRKRKYFDSYSNPDNRNLMCWMSMDDSMDSLMMILMVMGDWMMVA